jgi:YegS/Rv2252/BmrU family lipid kinase
MKKRIAFIINPMSGTRTKAGLPGILRRELDPKQYDDFRILHTEYKGHGTQLSAQLVREGYNVVVAVGGDGTVNEVARSLIHTNVALGIIPAGSGNGLSRHLNIPTNVVKATQLLNKSEVIKTDYGIVNGKPFFCTCGTGFDAYVSMEFARGKKRGIIGYLEKMVTGYFNYEPQNYKLSGDDINLDGKAFVITFANAAQWGNNAYIAPEASVQDGLLDVSIISKVPVIAIPTLALQLFTKNIHNDLLVTTLRTSEITLIRDHPGPFHYDGEPYNEGEKIEIRMVPDGLNVLVKKRF